MKVVLAWISGVAVMLPLYVGAQELAVVEVGENEDLKTDFIRVLEDEENVQLQTSVTRYVKEGVSVDLIGAVHIADQLYFTDLNTLFEAYEVLLYEMVGGERLGGGRKLVEDKEQDTQFNVLGAVSGAMQRKLGLAGQKEHVDYSKGNFVHADLTLKEFNQLQKEKKESILSFALKNGQSIEKAQEEGGLKFKEPSVLKLFRGLVTGNADMLKLNFVHTLGAGDEQIAAFAGNSVIIGDRNVKCLDVMNEQIEEGKKKIGIFYGAAHFPDMEERMLGMGFVQSEQSWMTAWEIDKGKAKAK